MAIFHLNSGFISRSSGRSVVQAVAYVAGEKLLEERRNVVANFTNRAYDVEHSETMMSDKQLEAFRKVYGENFRPIDVWNILENFEDGYAEHFYKNEEAKQKFMNCAQTAQTIVVAIPKELTRDNAIELLKSFAEERFCSRGLMVHIAMHQDEGNPHGHFVISRRAVSEEGEIAWKKDRDIVSRTDLKITRKLWADLTNQMLEKEGHTVQVTEKSYADLGLDIEPMRHRGWYADKLEQKGLQSYLGGENQKIFEANKAKIMARPELVLEELTATQATFTQTDIYRVLGRRLGDDAKSIAQVFEVALSKALVVGEGADSLIRYTSEKYRQVEENALEKVKELKEGIFSVGVDSRKVDALLTDKYAFFNAEQKEAVKAITRTRLSGSAKVSDQFNVLIGRAGAGKTTTLKAVSELYLGSGAKVLGTALSAMAADNLSKDAGIEARTIDSYLLIWQKYAAAQERFLSWQSIKEQGVIKQQQWYKDLKNLEKYQLTNKHVLLIDEAGMVGSEKWGKLLGFSQTAGAKVVAIGDDNQFKAIQAGDMFRGMMPDASLPDSKSNFVSHLQEIRRQSEPWMIEASKDFAELRLMAGLSKYDQHDKLRGVDHAHFTQSIARHYLEQAKENQQSEGLILAYENKTCHQINGAVRELLKERGALPKIDQLTINSRGYSVGDRIVCLQNNPKLGVSNGLRAEITDIKNKTLTIKTNDGKTVKIDSESYPQINHGYAVTTHKSQGQTLDYTVVAASKRMDAQALYVAMTRHKNETTLFYDKKDFSGFKDLARKLSRFEHKDLVSDYTILPENKIYHGRVQSYKDLTLDLASCSRSIYHGEASVNGPEKWDDYNSIKAERIKVGREILADFDRHQLYISQANLTKEGMEVECGLRARPLSQAEKLAKETLNKYVDISRKTRSFTKIIQNPKARSLISDDVKESYQIIRDKRFALAEVISNNAPLYKSLIRENYKETGLTLQSVQSVYSYGRSVTGDRGDGLVYGAEPSPVMVSKSFSDNRDNRSDIDTIKEKLNERVGDLAEQLIGDPNRRGSRELRFGSKGAISVQAYGPKQGLYCNFETGVKGGPLKLIEEQLRLDYKDAFKWAVEWLNEDHRDIKQYHKTPQQDLTKSSTQLWKPIYPAPEKTPDLKTDKYLSYMLKGREEVARYAYRDAGGNTLGHVVRLQDREGNKITPTLTYCEKELESGKFFKAWRWQGFGSENSSRPLYGLEQLAFKSRPDSASPVLIVEGEKTADAARKIFPNHVVITWSGGCGAVAKTDWSPLNNHFNQAGKEGVVPNVTIWPDHDQAGVKAANQVAKELVKQPKIKRSHVKIVDFSPDIFTEKLPHKWDLADELPKGVSENIYQTCLEFAPKMGEKILNYQLREDQIDNRVNQLHLSERFGGKISQLSESVTEFYKILLTFKKEQDPKTIDQMRYDQAIYMSLALQNPSASGNITVMKSKGQLLERAALEGQLFSMISNKKMPGIHGTIEKLADQKQAELATAAMTKEGRVLRCLDLSVSSAKIDEQKMQEVAKQYQTTWSYFFENAKQARYSDLIEKPIKEQIQAFVLAGNRFSQGKPQERIGSLENLFNALKITLHRHEEFIDKSNDQKRFDHLQTLYMAAKLQQQGEELSDPLKQKNVIAKTAIEGRLFAKDPTQPQSEIAKQAATLTKKYQHEAKGYPEEQRDLYFMVRSCKGHENIGLQMHHAEKMQQDLHKITRYVIDKYVEKQEQLYQQKSKEMGGPER